MDAAPSTLKLRRTAVASLGGRIKTAAESFLVEEIPAYELSGEGEHVHVRHRRRMRATRELVSELAAEFNLQERDIGYAGLKDKVAVAVQSFSLPLRTLALDEVRTRIEARLGGTVLDCTRHGNKLKRGHLRGNRFVVEIDGCRAGAEADARRMLDEIQQHGLINAYGAQRFGRDGTNAQAGARLLGRRPRSWLDQLKLNAWQSHLFNRWLEKRVAAYGWHQLIEGDIAKKTENGALFDVSDVANETPRRERLEIVPTGPMWGADMRRAKGEADQLEVAVLHEAGASLETLERTRLEGTRRAAIVKVDGVHLEPLDGQGLRLAFTLPKGSYATALLDELCGTVDLLDEGVDDA